MFGGMDIAFVNDPTWGRLREREPTRDNVLRTLRAWRPPEPLETMHACRVFVLNNMHISFDFNSLDFLGMLEVLGLLLIFMHRGNFKGISCDEVIYCAFATVPLCPDDTVTVWHIDCMICWLYVYCFVGYGPCILWDITKAVGEVDVSAVINPWVFFLRLNSYSPFVYLIWYMALVISSMVMWDDQGGNVLRK